MEDFQEKTSAFETFQRSEVSPYLLYALLSGRLKTVKSHMEMKTHSLNSSCTKKLYGGLVK
jgi:hypothetical protein